MLLQRFVLFLGHPTWSLVVVLPTLLIAAGLGSFTVRPTSDPRARLKRLLLWVPLAILFGVLVSGGLLDLLLGWNLVLRFILSVLLLVPVGFVLGMAFPAGVQLLDETRPELVPWAWAVNSFATVLGSTGTVLVAMETGFTWIMLGMVPLYFLGILALYLAVGSRPVAEPEPA